ncbi:thiol:disulfide interchange protein DsbD [Arsukibacterium tuosuense]|uniref:Thiol:disulfide interchange protein DsbD n=1 Tax=Arsukibacterium tuosuense TaxID=1323745 RepID=A0A285JHB6_9GAMM|nr:protein-disulfide reductase DsbD domain-containing protein [Arsukibacterium tuosuense]SNY59700.1 thiol:disulfide interchange protein DsbD [Arsukibacterium tuosuense]
MSRLSRWLTIRVLLLLSSLLAGFAVQASSSGWQQAKHIKAELVSEYRTVAAGQQFAVLLHFEPDPGWHTYWQNPGDSGLATSISWQLPAGVQTGNISWPTPQSFLIPPLVNYGYAGQTLLLTELTVPADYAADSLTINADVDWLVCEEICIPADASFELTLNVAGQSEPAASQQPLFAKARQALPLATGAVGDYAISGGAFSAELHEQLPEPPVAFFVASTELVDHAAAQQLVPQQNGWLLQQAINTYFSSAPQQVEVVLVDAAGQGYSVNLQYRQQPAEQGGSTEILLTGGILNNSNNNSNLWLILLMAAGGGLILNLMPCVFPVLSLKALSIAGNSQQRQQQRHDALFYTAGVVLSFLALAGLLIALRAAGNAIGWGFHLQSTLLVGLLAYLLLALGLSLSGLVQFGLGLMNAGGDLTVKSGGKGSFFTGVLAVIVASPCTAPFMGTALGYAVTQSPQVALLVFAALGLGMALPFLLLAYIPALARLLPKPGAWMETLKQLLAWPLYLSAVWLVWVFGRQTGIDAMALLLVGMVALSAALWLWGRVQLGAGWFNRLAALGLVLLAVITLWQVSSQQAALSSNPQPGQSTAQHWQSWSAEKLSELRRQGKPVLVNMTADWCITCLVNEQVALNTERSKAALTEYDVSYLKGDWTRRDSAITAYLQQYQRDGVPLYVLYWPGQPPQVLPQILTPDTLRQTFESLSQQ